jgi:Na+-transporting NADH:ubiquinone oxidoreductase subunit NqrB
LLDILLVAYVSGGEINFIVEFSLEVNDGLLVTSLPAELINTTELKLKNSYLWQPLQTYVTISKHFTVKANGIRFRGTVNYCNSIMQQLFYHVSELLLLASVMLLRVVKVKCKAKNMFIQVSYLSD